MLISDIARKVPRETSAIRVMVGVRLGHFVPLICGKDSGIRKGVTEWEIDRYFEII